MPRTAVNLALAALVVSGWAIGHTAVFVFDWSPGAAWLAAPLVLWQTWASAGLFIVAHDAMHGALWPRRPRWNDAVGGLCLTLYAGFSFRRLRDKHHDHHRHSGRAEDPDGSAGRDPGMAAWFWRFMRTYFGWRPFFAVAAIFVVETTLLGATPLNALVFWALPALLSSFQLFFFGTYLPHRPGRPFADAHAARSQDWPWALSLLSCYHFGRHHEHHLRPHEPWWRLPAVSQELKKAAPAQR